MRVPDRKQLGHESEISPLIVEQITEQLQQRVFLEIQKLCDTSKQQRRRRDGVSSGIERGLASRIDASDIRGVDGGDILLPLTPEEESNVREQSRMPFRLTERGVYAFLDHRDPTITGNDPEEVRYSDVPILYLQSSLKSSQETSAAASELASTMASEAESLEAEPVGIPLFKLNTPFLGPLAQQSRELLREAIYPSGSREQQQLTMIALCSSGNVHDQVGHSAEIESDNVQFDTGAGVEGREKSSDGVSLFIALWRLRLWNGMGWTVPVATTADKKLKRDDLDSQTRHVDEKTENEDVARQVREQTKGQVVQGFDVVQGVMHGKWM
ncbi:hypothetical protein QFC22_006223 [Naganishia vaughanmartiniae]|uniref:Uncharacterized protein n=1 Tax=Naganishia vaughanmartiniae TaxID=1424756 RepID=A0ACC2WPG9_9TREE|nr:hypothetical protein QFC22_006223 [Naganishia vaughanmartiniae]